MANSVVSTKDVRKYSNDVGSNLPIVVTDGLSFGNFQTISSAINWLKLNPLKNAEVIIRGESSITTETSLEFDHEVIIRGDSGTLTIGNNTTTSNICFKDLTLNLYADNAFRIGSDTKLTNCIFEFDVNTEKGIVLQSGSQNIEITDSTFNYTKVITPVDLVNSGHAAVYSSISSSSSLKNVIIKNNIFNYTPASTGSSHYPFINFELTSLTSLLHGVFIQNNKFLNPAASATLDVTKDFLAAIAIICTQTSTGVTYPTVSDIFIQDNFCDNRQLFIITTTKSGSPSVIRNDFVLKNVHITNNTVGAIGYYTSANGVYITPSPANFVTNKPSGLIISNNTTTLIASMDETGTYHSLYDTIGTGSYTGAKDLGKVLISNNNVSFIHTGAGEEISILNNRLTPTPVSGLASYSDSNDIAIYVAQKTGGTGNVIVSENIISQANTLSSGTPSTEDYQAPINVLCSNQIINNLIKNVVELSYGINVGGLVNQVSGNQIYRNANSIDAYIKASHPNTLSASANGQIVDNFFDSTTIDGSTEILDASTIPAIWAYERNKNQTKRILISLVDNSTYVEVPVAAPTDDDYLQTLLDTGTANATVYRNVNANENSYVVVTCGEISSMLFRQFIDLHNLLPQNTTIMNIRLATYVEDSGDGITLDFTPSSNNKFLFHVISTKSQKTDDIMDIKTYLDTPDTLQADIQLADTVFPFPITYPKIINNTVFTALKAATQYYELPVTSGDEKYFVNDGDRLIQVQYQLNYFTTATGDGASFVRFNLSPLEVKVRF